MEDKDCLYCKHSYFEDLDNELCCRLTHEILRGIPNEDASEFPMWYEVTHPACEKFEQNERWKKYNG